MANERLAAWRAGRTETLILPSGLTVTVRRVTLLDLASSGQVPMPLMGMVDRLINEGRAADLDMAQLPQFIGLIDATITLALIDPPVADAPDDEHLGINELPTMDKIAIFNWLNAPAEQLAPFRAGSGAVVDTAPGGPDVRVPAVDHPGA
jgi:hypothetical protein